MRRYLLWVLIFKLKEFIAKQLSYSYKLQCSEQIEFQLCVPCSPEVLCNLEQERNYRVCLDLNHRII